MVVADMVADMEVDMVADMELDMVADMEIDKAADIEVNMVADMVAMADINIDIQFDEKLGWVG